MFQAPSLRGGALLLLLGLTASSHLLATAEEDVCGSITDCIVCSQNEACGWCGDDLSNPEYDPQAEIGGWIFRQKGMLEDNSKIVSLTAHEARARRAASESAAKAAAELAAVHLGAPSAAAGGVAASATDLKSNIWGDDAGATAMLQVAEGAGQAAAVAVSSSAKKQRKGVCYRRSESKAQSCRDYRTDFCDCEGTETMGVCQVTVQEVRRPFLLIVCALLAAGTIVGTVVAMELSFNRCGQKRAAELVRRTTAAKQLEEQCEGEEGCEEQHQHHQHQEEQDEDAADREEEEEQEQEMQPRQMKTVEQQLQHLEMKLGKQEKQLLARAAGFSGQPQQQQQQ